MTDMFLREPDVTAVLDRQSQRAFSRRSHQLSRAARKKAKSRRYEHQSSSVYRFDHQWLRLKKPGYPSANMEMARILYQASIRPSKRIGTRLGME